MEDVRVQASPIGTQKRRRGQRHPKEISHEPGKARASTGKQPAGTRARPKNLEGKKDPAKDGASHPQQRTRHRVHCGPADR